MEILSNIINSPILLLGIILLLIIYFVRCHYTNKKCKFCGIGKMQEVSRTPLGINSQPHSGLGKVSYTFHGVRIKVKYQCNNCKEFNETIESR